MLKAVFGQKDSANRSQSITITFEASIAVRGLKKDGRDKLVVKHSLDHWRMVQSSIYCSQ